MAYEPKEWACGDVVTAEALNNIEQGIADASQSGAFIIEATGNLPNLTGDKTFEELLQAINDGRPCIIRWDASQGYGQQVMLYRLMQYNASGTNRTALFTNSMKTSGATQIETLRMSENGTITLA